MCGQEQGYSSSTHMKPRLKQKLHCEHWDLCCESGVPGHFLALFQFEQRALLGRHKTHDGGTKAEEVKNGEEEKRCMLWERDIDMTSAEVQVSL